MCMSVIYVNITTVFATSTSKLAPAMYVGSWNHRGGGGAKIFPFPPCLCREFLLRRAQFDKALPGLLS
jgi:hypothetical protein